jgi:cytochrome c biogenesis protein CcmG/thiol:disulfide interchange protein DsbE
VTTPDAKSGAAKTTKAGKTGKTGKTAPAGPTGGEGDTGATAGRHRTVLAVAITVAAISFVAVRFFAGAHETLSRTRDGSCRALGPDLVPAALQGREAPDFQLPDASGQTISLRSQRGHPVILNFWATWCPPCVDEVPSIEELARRIDGTDLRMLAVSVDDEWSPVRRFFPKGTKIGVLLDPERKVAKSYGTDKFPETYLIDAEGRVRYYFINKRDWSRPEAFACLESLRR